MGICTEIEAAFDTQLATLATPPPIAWPNTDYKPVEGTLFIRPTLMPATGALNTIAGSYLNKGFYQVDVFCPLDKGTASLNTWLDAIFTLFSGTKTLTASSQNIFIQDIIPGKAERQDGWYHGFIEIHYSCYTN